MPRHGRRRRDSKVGWSAEEALNVLQTVSTYAQETERILQSVHSIVRSLQAMKEDGSLKALLNVTQEMAQSRQKNNESGEVEHASDQASDRLYSEGKDLLAADKSVADESEEEKEEEEEEEEDEEEQKEQGIGEEEVP